MVICVAAMSSSLYSCAIPKIVIDFAHIKVRKTLSTWPQSEEPRVEENPCVEGDRMEEGLLGGHVSPLEATRTPQPHNLTFAEGGAKRLENPSTTDHVEVPQPQVAASANGEARTGARGVHHC
jgi:hypothetical protein